MADKKPKDYLMAEAAYNAFYQQQPQVFFDNLAHDYQMKWVAVAREVALVHDTYKTGPRKGKFKSSEEVRARWREQKRKSQAKLKGDNDLPKKTD